MRIITLILAILLSASPCLGAVLFEDNFDSQADWSPTQPANGNTSANYVGNYPTGNPPTGWQTYWNNMTYVGTGNCSGSNALNDFYINAIPGYPVAESGTCYGGSGKCVTYWQERCCSQQVCSPGEIGVDLGQGYSELYVRWRAKYSATWAWRSDVPQMKIAHIQAYSGSGTPYSYFHQTLTNQPIVIPGLKTFSGNVYYYVGYRCEGDGNDNYGCKDPLYHHDISSEYGGEDDVDLGQISLIFDGNWHTYEVYVKTNSAVGVADGVSKFWLDGTLKYDSSSNIGGHSEGIAFAGTAGQASPRIGFRHISFGGNNSNYTDSCSGAGCEQWYAIDDVVISTTPIGVDYVIGGADETAPTISQISPSSQQTCTSNPRNVTRTWTTNENATCRIHATSSTWAEMAEAGTTGGTSHSDTASQACGATYTPYIVCQDASENESTASQMSYTIAAEAASAKQVTIGGGSNTVTKTGGTNTISR